MVLAYIPYRGMMAPTEEKATTASFRYFFERMIPMLKSAIWKNPIVVGFALASLFSDMGHELVSSLTPGFLTYLGAPPIALGLIEGISLFIASLAAIWGGFLASKTQPKNPLLLGYLATALKALYALVFFWPLLIIIRSIAWFGRGLRGPIRDHIIASSVDKTSYGIAFGLREALDTVGGLLGPLLAYFGLIQLGYRPLFGLSVLPGIIAMLVVLALPIHKTRNLQTVNDHRTQTKNIFTLPPIYKRLLLTDTLYAMASIAPTFYILFAVKSEVAQQGLLNATLFSLLLYVWFNLIYAISAYVLGFLSDRSSPRRVLVMGYAILCLSLTGFALNPHGLIEIGCLLTGVGIATGAQDASQKSFISQAVRVQNRGQALGIHAASLGLGNLVGSLCIGILWTQISSTVAFATLAIFAFIATVLMLAWVNTTSQYDTFLSE